MTAPSYMKNGLVVQRRGSGFDQAQVRDLQRDLRALGYLRRGIDGRFGRGTEQAVKALQHDLLTNDGRGRDGEAEVAPLDFNRGRVIEVTGAVDSALAGCIRDMLAEPKFARLPFADDPRDMNRRVAEGLGEARSVVAPVPFMAAIFRQETGLRHYNEPGRGDEDGFVVVGLDNNHRESWVITSRGYGLGQYTLFHHPPTRAEVDDVVLDVRRNARRSFHELRDKLDRFVIGATSGTRADDRVAEAGTGSLRLCKYERGDARYMKDCRQCALDAGATDIVVGESRWYTGSRHRYTTTKYYRTARYEGVPVRAKFPCDWPYAARRYNGAGTNSYHYQARILLNLLKD